MILTESLPTYLHQVTTPLVYAVCRRDDGAGQPTRREHVEIKLNWEEQWKSEDWRSVEIILNTWVQRAPRRRDPFTGRDLKKVKTFTTLVDRWRTWCGRQPQSAERMEELVDSVWSVVRQGNECEDQWEGVQDSGKTGNDVRGRDIWALKMAQEQKFDS